MGRASFPQSTRASLRHPLTWIALAWLGLAACQALAAPGRAAGCLIEPDQMADVGSPVTGIIEQLPVALGDTVKAGQTVALLRSDVERASARVAESRSRVDAEARAAQAQLTLARQKADRAQDLVSQNFVSHQALDQARAEVEVALQRWRLAQSQQQIHRQEQDVASAQLALRTLRSPISGVVIERFSNLGERVEDRPVLRIASIDPLRVSLMVPMTQYGQIRVGDRMTVRPELQGAAPVTASVQYIDKVVDAASNTFRVRLHLPNPDHSLPGGLRCKAEPLRSAAAAPAASPAVVPVAQTSARPEGLVLKPSLQLHKPASTRMAALAPERAAPGRGLALRSALSLRRHPGISS